MPVETLGGWHSKAVDQIMMLAEAQVRDEDEARRHLFQRLSVLLVKGNAAILLNRKPLPPPARDRLRNIEHPLPPSSFNIYFTVFNVR